MGCIYRKRSYLRGKNVSYLRIHRGSRRIYFRRRALISYSAGNRTNHSSRFDDGRNGARRSRGRIVHRGSSRACHVSWHVACLRDAVKGERHAVRIARHSRWILLSIGVFVFRSSWWNGSRQRRTLYGHGWPCRVLWQVAGVGMPKRPPKNWMNRCMVHVGFYPKAVDPGAICASTFRKMGKTARDIAMKAERQLKRKSS